MNVKLNGLVHKKWIFRSAILAVTALAALGMSNAAAAQGRGGAGRGAAAAPQPLPMDAAGHPDMSGYWELRYDSRGITPASLTQDAMAKAAAQRDHDRLAIRWCANVGMPEVMGDGATLDIRQGLKDVALVAKTVSSVRYIYLDGRKHPDKDEMEPSTNGNSIGQWDGETLVVDTIGFSDRGMTAIPGGGFRTPDSHLTERFHLMQGGRMLSVTFTWDDPKVYQKPHSYEFRYYKVPQNGYPLQYPCNAGDPDRAKFLIPDAQTAAGR